jgi:hypothetical protein
MSTFRAFLLAQWKVPILLGAGVVSRFHRRTTQWTTRAAGGDDRRCFGAELSRLFAADAARQARAVALVLHIMRNDDETITPLVESEFHAAGAKLISSVGIEIQRRIRFPHLRSLFRELIQHLLKGKTKRLHLLLLHPNDMRFATDERKETESSLPGFSQCLDPDPLYIAFRPTLERLICHEPHPRGRNMD